MSAITIEGSLTPASGVLAKGERSTVQYTDRIQGWIDKGFVVQVGEIVPDIEVGDVVVPPLDDETAADLPTDGEAVAVPSHNASTDTWSTFLEENVPGIVIPDDAKRSDLIAAWEAYQQQVNGGS